MKKNSVILASIIFTTVGCESWHSDRDENSGTMKEPAGAQSPSSDINAASSSQTVGQSGTSTNQNSSANEPAGATKTDDTNSVDENNPKNQ